MNYLNEYDPQCAAWLTELRDQGLIPPCEIDTRSIEDVHPNDLRGFKQCHFFSGIGGWPLALALAGWPADRPVWTGSCPCQPFSAAGSGAGFADERHLWPAFHWLIHECRPPVVFGEQVASAAVGPWLDLVLTDLEALGYASGAIAFPAAGIGAPHIRDRTYWVAHTAAERHQVRDTSSCTSAGWERQGAAAVRFGSIERLADTDGRHASAKREQCGREQRQQQEDGGCVQGGSAGPVNGHWRAADWLGCRDGKWRPVEPGTFPLAHGLPARVGRLRGYGNAIVPQAAAEFIKAMMEVCSGTH